MFRTPDLYGYFVTSSARSSPCTVPERYLYLQELVDTIQATSITPDETTPISSTFQFQGFVRFHSLRPHRLAAQCRNPELPEAGKGFDQDPP